MFYHYFIIFSAFLWLSLSYASDVELTEESVVSDAETQKAFLKIGAALLERHVHFNVELPLQSDSSPRTPKKSSYGQYCIRVMQIVEEGKESSVISTLDVTPTLKTFTKRNSPNSEKFFDRQEFDFSICLSSFALEGEKEEQPAVTLRIWENRNLMIYLVHQDRLEEALAAFPEGEESFEQALYKAVDIKEELKGTGYFLGEVASLKRAWKYLYDELRVLNLADRFPVYKRRLQRYVTSFEKVAPRQETEFDRIVKKAGKIYKQDQEGNDF
ncbi:MAG TPA: hypothetical protein DD412_05835 [Holosporales bacterium]|nr:hypothetical protein [Holosporales bacterium]